MKNKKLYICKCCGYYTIETQDNYEICPLCGWQDEHIDYESLFDTLNNYSCNNISLFEAQENFLKKTNKSARYCYINSYSKDSEFVTVKEKTYRIISLEKNLISDLLLQQKINDDNQETYHLNLFRIVLQYLKDKEISDYNKRIMEIFNCNICPILKLDILSYLVCFKTKIIEEFLISYIIECDNLSEQENEIINSYWKTG